MAHFEADTAHKAACLARISIKVLDLFIKALYNLLTIKKILGISEAILNIFHAILLWNSILFLTAFIFKDL